MPHVTVQSRTEDGLAVTVYHTPAGDVFTRTRTHTGRVSDALAVETEGMIKSVADHDPVIWVNFPETIFWLGPDETKRYTIQLLKSDAPGDALVLGFTEMGLWGATDDETEQCFKAGTMAIMEAIEEVGNCPIVA